VTFNFRKSDTFVNSWFQDQVLDHPGALERDNFGATVGVYGEFAVVSASTTNQRKVCASRSRRMEFPLNSPDTTATVALLPHAAPLCGSSPLGSPHSP
jgi:hypothetical protein